MFGGLRGEDFLDGLICVSLGADILAPEFEVGVDTVHVVIQEKGLGRFWGGSALVDGLFVMAAWGSVGAVFHEMEAIGGAVATIGSGSNGAFTIGMRFIATNLIFGAEGAGVSCGHFRTAAAGVC